MITPSAVVTIPSAQHVRTVGGLGIAVGIIAAGCTTTSSDVEIDEGGVLTTSFRGLYRWAEDPWSPREQQGSLTALEVEVSLLDDDADQTLAAGETIQLDDRPFTGPGEVDYDVRVLGAAVVTRGGFVFPNGLTVEGLFGLGFHQVEIDGAFGALSDEVEVFSAGPRFGLELGYHPPRPAGRLRFFARGWAGFEYPDERDYVDVSEVTVGGGWRVGEHVFLALGWRWWRYEAEESSGPESDLQLELSGPLILFEVMN